MNVYGRSIENLFTPPIEMVKKRWKCVLVSYQWYGKIEMGTSLEMIGVAVSSSLGLRHLE